MKNVHLQHFMIIVVKLEIVERENLNSLNQGGQKKCKLIGATIIQQSCRSRRSACSWRRKMKMINSARKNEVGVEIGAKKSSRQNEKLIFFVAIFPTLQNFLQAFSSRDRFVSLL